MTSFSLSPETEYIATALGILKAGAVNGAFFSAPWDHVGKILSDDGQRSALVSAIERLLPPSDPAALEPAASGKVRGCYPLLEQGGCGQVYLKVERDSAAPGSALTLGVAAEIKAGGDGPSVVADLVLIAAGNGSVHAVAGTDSYPLSIKARVPVGDSGAAVAASLLIVAPLPSNTKKSRLTFSVEGVSDTAAPLVYDLSDAAPPVAGIVTGLLQLALAMIGDSAAEEVQHCADALAPLLGLTAGVPPFPFGELAKDPASALSSLKDWLAKLVAAPLADGQRPFLAWLSAFGELLDAGVQSAPGTDGTEDGQVVLTLVEAGATPGLDVTVGVRTDSQSGTPSLVIGLRAELPSGGIDANLQADVALCVIPLSGTAAVTFLESVDLIITAPATDHPLIDPSDTGGLLAVGSLQAGIRYQGSAGAPKVIPVLALSKVTVSVGGKSVTSDRLDLTNVGTLTQAAESALSAAFSDGLNSEAEVVKAFCTLLGIGTTPSLAMEVFASDPYRALVDYYRRLRGETDGWPRLLGALGTLLGSAHPAGFQGSGTAEEPWRIDLDALTAQSGFAPAVKLAIWDAGEATLPRFCLALRAELSAPRCELSADLQLLSVELPAQGAGEARWLSGITAKCTITPPADISAMDGIAVSTGAITCRAAWAPGERLLLSAQIKDVSVQADGDPIPIGTLSFPLADAVDYTKPDLGLGVDPVALSEGIRLLLCRACGSWGGPAAGALLGLLFGGAPQTAGIPEELASAAAECFDISAFLRTPLATLRSWCATLGAGTAALTADGVPLIRVLLNAVQLLLTNRVPLPGTDPLPPELPVSGAGTGDDPWRVPLQGEGCEPVELTVWEGPAGPPASWTCAALPPAGQTPLAADLVTAAYRIAGSNPALSDLFAYREMAGSVFALECLNDALGDGDGILSVASAIPDDPAWTVGEPVDAAHHKLPASVDTVNQILQWIDTQTQALTPDAWAVLLLAPPLAGPDCWELLLSGVDAGDRCSITLRDPATTPLQADLTGTLPARWYEIDLADDGSAPLADVVAALGRVVNAIQKVNPTARVVLVAHSYLGPVARQFAAEQASRMLGVATIGAPVRSGFLGAIDSAALADGVRLATTLAPDGLVSGSMALGDALDFLARSSTGWDSGQSGSPPAAAPFPATAFLRELTTPQLPAGVPAFAVYGSIGDSVISALAETLYATAQAAGADPAYLAWGVRTGLGLPAAADGEPEVTADIGLELGRISFGPATAADTPAALTVRVTLGKRGDWLLSDPAAGAQVRWLELLGRLTAVNGSARVTVELRLHDASLRGGLRTVADLSDPCTPELLDNLLRKLDDPAQLQNGGRVDALLQVLAGLGLVRRGSSGAPAPALADGWNALARDDAAARLAPLLAQLLDARNGLFGFTRPAGALAGGGPWIIGFAPLPVELRIDTKPWRITVHSTEQGIEIGPDSSLRFTGTVPLSDLAADVSGSLAIAGASLRRDSSTGSVLLTASWLDKPLSLVPPDPDTPKILASALPPVLVSAVVTAVIEQMLDGIRLESLVGLFHDPGAWLSRAEGLGDGYLPQAAKVKELLQALADAAGWPVDTAKPIALPGGLLLDIVDTAAGGSSGVGLEVGTDPNAPLVLWNSGLAEASLDFRCRLDLDQKRHVTPGGSLTLSVPLPCAWKKIVLSLGAGPAGLSANLQTDTGVNLTLLPSVAGVDTLLKAAEAAAEQQLLPFVLDQIASYFAHKPAPPPVLDEALAVAAALGIYDGAAPPGSGFSQKGDQLAQLLADFAQGTIQAGPLTGAAVAILQRLLGTTAVPAPAAPGRIAIGFRDVLGGALGIEVDFSTTPVGVRVDAQAIAAGAFTLGASAGIESGAPVAAVEMGTSFDTGFGLTLQPWFSAQLNGGAFTLVCNPLGVDEKTGKVDDEVTISLAPTFAVQAKDPSKNPLLILAEAWIVPLAGTMLLRVLDATGVLAYHLLPGDASTLTIEEIVGDQGMKVALRKAGQLSLADPLPDPGMLLHGLLDGLANAVTIKLPGAFDISFIKDRKERYGIAVGGQQSFNLGDYSLALHLGLPPDLPPGLKPGWQIGNDDMGGGIGLLFFDDGDHYHPKLIVPVLRLGGLGFGLSSKEPGKPLISAGGFQLGAVSAYLSADIPLEGKPAATSESGPYGAIQLDNLGLFIASGDNEANPVASSILKSGGSGDAAPANPPFSLMAASFPGGFAVQVNGEAKVRIEVRKTYGPFHIEEIDLLYDADKNAVGAGITGGVSMSGLALEVDDLSLLVPLNSPTKLETWSCDLAGLALGYQSSSVSLSGGLRKAKLTLDDKTQVVDYEGGISVQVSGRGFSAIGAYCRVNDAGDQYTSLFVFLAINMPIGGPPYLYVIGLAGGVGYNRRLLTPRDPAGVGSFPLVSAMTGACSDPMQQLIEVGKDIPPCHGAFWLAAGARFSTFALLQSTALITVSIDHGFEVSLLGLMQLAIPPKAVLVSLELALSVKYSTVDQVFSLQAALTENSWLISKDCQVTGGFAFVIWFQGHEYPTRSGSPEVLLSVGGYSKYFPIDQYPYYPVVPRVGFRWNVGSGILVKGESFFTLTQSGIMFGGALEASYDVSPIRIWFSADLDVMIMWDPLKYAADVSVEIGAAFHYDIDLLFGTLSIDVSVTLGASVRLEGPPLHGEATVELLIATVTVPFGDCAAPLEFIPWDVFCWKYIEGGDAGADPPPLTLPGTAFAIARGAVASADKPDGSEGAPFAVSPLFTMHLESKMPASGWSLGSSSKPTGAQYVDVVPCDPNEIGRVKGSAGIVVEKRGAQLPDNSYDYQEIADYQRLEKTENTVFFAAATWDASKVPSGGGGADDTRPQEMLSAVGSVELAAVAVVSPDQGDDVSLATMIDDRLPPLGLDFGPVPEAVRPAARRLRTTRSPEAAPPAHALSPRAPELHRVLGAPAKLSAASRAEHPPASVKEKVADRAVILPKAGAQVWKLDPRHAHGVDISGKDGGVRVTALGGTGGVIADKHAQVKKSHSPAGTTRLLITDHLPGEFAGWESDTPLLYAGPATALAPGATVHAPGPWTPPARFGRAGSVCWIPAAALASQFERLTTRFSFEAGHAPTVVIVRLERAVKGAGADEVGIELDGGKLGEAQLVRSGAHLDMVFRVHDLRAGCEALCVRVAFGARWLLVGVVATTGAAARHAGSLSKRPHARLMPAAPTHAAARWGGAGAKKPIGAIKQQPAITVHPLKAKSETTKRNMP